MAGIFRIAFGTHKTVYCGIIMTSSRLCHFDIGKKPASLDAARVRARLDAEFLATTSRTP